MHVAVPSVHSMQIVHKAKDNAAPVARGETVWKRESIGPTGPFGCQQKPKQRRFQGIYLKECWSTFKLSLPQHNETVGLKEKAVLGHSVNICAMRVITVVMCQHMLRPHVQRHTAVSYHVIKLSKLPLIPSFCISVPWSLKTSPFESQATWFTSPSAKLQVMRRQSDKACLATMSVRPAFLLKTKGLACVI